MNSHTLDQTLLRAANLLQELSEVEPELMKDWAHGMKPANQGEAVANLISDTILALLMQKAGSDG